MSTIEIGIRGGAIALLLLLVVLLLRDRRGIPVARYCALFVLGAAANLVSAAPVVADDPSLWLIPLRVLAYGNPVVFWVLASSLFDDDFVPSWWHGAIWLVLVALNFWALVGGGSPVAMSRVLALLCIAFALWHVMAGRADDLVEARRRIRVSFVSGVGLFTAGMILSATWFQGGHGHPLFGYADSVGTLVLAGYFAFRLLGLSPVETFLPIPPAAADEPSEPSVLPAPPPTPEDPREIALLAALRRLLEDQHVYREESLSIAALAARLEIPEYRLRRLINGRLGHRNFSAFLNGYRLDEVIARLADASKAELPILTLALDAGFQSIGPFNRAFRSRTGITPSEFRRQCISQKQSSNEKDRAAPEID